MNKGKELLWRSSDIVQDSTLLRGKGNRATDRADVRLVSHQTGAISRCTLPSSPTPWCCLYLSPWIALHHLLTAKVRDWRSNSAPWRVRSEREDENVKYHSLLSDRAACGSKPKPHTLSIIDNHCLWKSPGPNGRAYNGADSPLKDLNMTWSRKEKEGRINASINSSQTLALVSMRRYVLWAALCCFCLCTSVVCLQNVTGPGLFSTDFYMALAGSGVPLSRQHTKPNWLYEGLPLLRCPPLHFPRTGNLCNGLPATLAPQSLKDGGRWHQGQ